MQSSHAHMETDMIRETSKKSFFNHLNDKCDGGKNPLSLMCVCDIPKFSWNKCNISRDKWDKTKLNPSFKVRLFMIKFPHYLIISLLQLGPETHSPWKHKEGIHTEKTCHCLKPRFSFSWTLEWIFMQNSDCGFCLWIATERKIFCSQ